MSPFRKFWERSESSHENICFQLLAPAFTIRQRNFRTCISILLAFFTIAFLLTILQLINNLTYLRHTSSTIDRLLTFTNDIYYQPKTGLENTRTRSHFADFGVRLVKKSHKMNYNQGIFKEYSPHVPTSTEYSWPDVDKYKFSQKGFSVSTQLLDQNWINKNHSFSMKGQEEAVHVSDIHQETSSQATENKTLASATESSIDLFLVILVISQPDHVLLRQAARQTWVQGSKEMGVRIVFVVGRQDNWDEIINREDRIHQDVLIEDEADTYEYLPNKVLAGITWLLQLPQLPKYVMKVDDDTVVNLPYLLRELHVGVINSSQILGAICVNSTVLRDPADKWAVSVLDYPLSTYPPYASGGGYVMATSAAASLVEARSTTSDWVHLEDVYITGILARKCEITHVAHPAFSYWMSKKASACDFVENKRITSVNHTEKEIRVLYSQMQELLRSRNTTQCTPALNLYS